MKAFCYLFGSGYNLTPDGGITCIDFSVWGFGFTLFVLLCVFGLLGKEPKKEPMVFTNDWANLDESKATVTKMADGRVWMEYDTGNRGTFYFIAGRDKRGAFVQETDRSGKRCETKVYGAQNAWRFGQSPDDSLWDYVKHKINTERR